MIMTIYLIHEESELHMVRILPEQEAAFLEKYAQRILVSRDTVREVLRKFDEMPVIICNGV